MSIEYRALIRLAQGCVLEAVPRFNRTGVRIVNHRITFGGSRAEWLTIVKPNGSIVVWQHFPVSRTIARLAGWEVDHLTRKPAGRFTNAQIKGHVRDATRRRR